MRKIAGWARFFRADVVPDALSGLGLSLYRCLYIVHTLPKVDNWHVPILSCFSID
jgi:hypothetical protein